MNLLDLIVERLLWLIPLILSITVHEWAHAACANWLGDDTARLLGRNTLNPMAHIDPVGTLLLPLLGIPFGWAKPVPINVVRFHRGVSLKLGVLLVAAAGPLSNLCLAGAGWLLMQLPVLHDIKAIIEGLTVLTAMNLSLAIFNMLPIPPLDGSRVVDSLMPSRFRSAWNSFSNIGFVVLLALFVIPILLMGVSMLEWLASFVTKPPA